MLNVLITGGAGFIGSHLADALTKRGDLVVCLDDFTTGRPQNIPRDAQPFECNVCDINSTSLVDRQFDVVLHCAASYNDPDDYGRDVLTNVYGMTELIEFCQNAGVPRMIYFQTALCYGLGPFCVPIETIQPLHPEGSSYAYSKTVAEQYLQLSGLPHLTYRMANIYGPRNLSGPVPTFFKRITQNQKCTVVKTRRDFVYIGDLVRLVIAGIDSRATGVVHVASGKDYSIKELFDAVRLGCPLYRAEYDEIERGEDDAPTILLDPTLTKMDFGWVADTPLKAGVRRACRWYEKHGVGATYTHLRMPEDVPEGTR